jgi:hypothetical protein
MLTFNGQTEKHCLSNLSVLLVRRETSISRNRDIFKIFYLYKDEALVAHIYLKSLCRYNSLSEN